MADSVAQTKLDEITLGKIQGDAIRGCIERLNDAIANEDGNTYHIKGVVTPVGKICDAELINVIKEIIERIRELDMQTYQNDMRFDRGGTLTLKPDVDFPKINAFSDTPIEDSEKHLKKLIKHAKTPMERKMYEKKLNALYKKRKKK